ncbi:MAG: hypothetical protein Q27BB25_10465 [Blastomonas sp. CACIA14H2]|nr:MAG: hypothetical protein Q27BB25_10465 [Blastomonas sp. CACIA14H2]
MEIEQQQGSLMRPVFEHAAVSLLAPCRLLQFAEIVTADTRIGWEIVRSCQNIHAIDLDHAQPVQRTMQMSRCPLPGTPLPEPLRSKHDASGIVKGKLDGHAGKSSHPILQG